MSSSPNDHPIDWFPDWFLTGSQKPFRADVRRLVPGSPLPTGGTSRRTPRPLIPTTGSQTPVLDASDRSSLASRVGVL
jgi:hypothetical protein